MWWACDMEFHAETFEAMAQMSKTHGSEMMEKQDPQHLEAMNKMRDLMKDPVAMQAWFADKKAKFDSMPSD